MILQRFLEGLLVALSWLIDLLFGRIMLLALLFCLGLGALLLIVIRRARMRGAALQALPSLDVAALARKQGGRQS
jgi:hypothetical protein